jgi:hypothetical protein
MAMDVDLSLQKLFEVRKILFFLLRYSVLQCFVFNANVDMFPSYKVPLQG